MAKFRAFQNQDLLLGIAVGVNLVVLLSFFQALWREGFFSQKFFSRPVFLSPEKDPPLGSPIPQALVPFWDSQKPLLVVAFGRCSECTIETLSAWVLMLERWADEVRGVIVAQENKKRLQTIWLKEGWKLPFLADEKGRILQELNAYFLPRVYGFDGEGKLVFKQEDLRLTALEAIRLVVEAVKGKEYAKRVFDRKPAWAESREAKPATHHPSGGR